MTIHRVFYYKLEKQKNEEHEDCWPLLNTTGGAHDTKRYKFSKRQAKILCSKKAARQEMEETRKKKRSEQSSKINRN